MSKLSPSSPALNRLRAAAGLIPLIEDGLHQARMGELRAEKMINFCEWATNHELTCNEAVRLTTDIQEGLKRIKALFLYPK